MESPSGYPESPVDLDDTIYPCKGCGQILEEGKAFELAGNRWHIDCFRCNTCGTLLDSDANLLLLGDGSLICNNCTYSCSSCGNKIEDLAILTGDQAFCANCFKCRNCKRKIENLRYARTSQGIFCMECHESLMARRRKRSARNATQRQKAPGVHLDKSLPPPPPSSTPTTAVPSEPASTSSDMFSVKRSTELPPRSRPEEDQGPSSRDEGKKVVPVSKTIDSGDLILPSSTYRSKSHSLASHKSDGSGGEEFLIPVAFDPTPTEHHSPNIQQPENSKGVDERPRDYFSRGGSGDTSGKPSADRHGYLKDPGRTDHPAEQPSAHIAYQEKRRPEGDPMRRLQDGSNGSIGSSPSTGSGRAGQQNVSPPSTSQHSPDTRSAADKFKLQDVPKGKKSGSSVGDSRDDTASREDSKSSAMPRDEKSTQSAPPRELFKSVPGNSQKVAPSDSVDGSAPRPTQESRLKENGSIDSSRSGASSSLLQLQNLPKRADSLDSKLHHTIQRKEVSSAKPGQSQEEAKSDISISKSSTLFSEPNSIDKSSSGKEISKGGESSSSKQSFDVSTPVTSPRTRTGSSNVASKDHFTPPRAPTQPSSENRINHHRNESISTLQSEPQRSADLAASSTLPRYNAGADFSMDEDMARILGTDESQNSFLRRVSNSVRHGRSFSDKGSRLSKEQKWPKSPSMGSNFAQDISSPSTSSPENRDELSWFKNELRRERQKVIEKDQKISELENALNAAASIKQVNTELREKRSTMVYLDAQKEIVLRELEVLTEHIAAEKRSGSPLDLGKISNSVLREFAEALQRLKDSFTPQIEDLMQKRNSLVEELGNLDQMKDKSLQEFEQLSLKNSQLADLNNQLVHQIQELYKANSNPSGEGNRQATNGLGIYSHHKDKSTASVEAREIRPPTHDVQLSASSGNAQEEAEPVTVIQGPQVVNIRKGQPKKFNWKKGGQNVAKGVTKGLKGALLYAEGRYQREGQTTETGPYVSLSPPDGNARSQAQDPSRPGFPFFGNQKKPTPWKIHPNGSSSALAEPSMALFGSDLEQRLEFEKAVIPGIVIRCIEEVELRGMDAEGIYRKSGGSSQVQSLREGFERSPDHDISDPDLDIHAVTSALKQYFRKLPTPLITHDVYDKILDTNSVTPISARIEMVQRSLQDLPRVHRDVLEFLIFHLKRVVDREKENLMTSQNVAVVFAPTILRPESVARELSDVQKKNEALRFLVENCQEIFMGMEQ